MVIKFFRILILVTMVLASLATSSTRAEGQSQQADTPETKAEALLKNLTPEERVGQLFLVTFTGADVGEGSQIYDLIFNHHVGGVTLEASNDNFTDSGTTTADAYRLINQLQSAAFYSSQQTITDQAGNTSIPAYVPLFIAISQEGDGYPYDQILSGMTRLPSPMAIGATWKPSLAAQAGTVLGTELQAIGF